MVTNIPQKTFACRPHRLPSFRYLLAVAARDGTPIERKTTWMLRQQKNDCTH